MYLKNRLFTFMFAMFSEAWTNTKWLLKKLESKLLYESRDIKIVLWHEFTQKIILKASKWQNLSQPQSKYVVAKDFKLVFR